MGAILYAKGEPISWLALDWGEDDLALLKAEVGNPAWQAEWELLAILIAVDTWLPRLRGEAACLVQADATAVLFAAQRMAGRTAPMNALAAEIALRLESAQVNLNTEHFRATLNYSCDALSRLSQGAKVPQRLLTVSRCWPRPRRAQFFWGWPKEMLQEE